MWNQILVAFLLVANAEAQPQTESLSAPRPKERMATAENNNVKLTYRFRPAVAVPSEVAEIEVEVGDKTGGRAIESVTGTVISSDGKVLDKYRLHALPGYQSRYGMHASFDTKGLYQLLVKGKMTDGASFEDTTIVLVDVWPLPKELDNKATRSQTRVPIQTN